MSGTEKILVTGATVNVGGVVVQYLLAMGADIRAPEHQQPITQELREAGAEAVRGDLRVPESLDTAFDCLDKVFLYTPLTPDAAEMAANGIAAAKRAGSPHVVRLSEVSPEPVSALRIGMMQAEIDAKLEASGLPFTSVRPIFFMQNTTMAAPTVASDGAIYMPFKDGKLSMIDIRDVAEVSVEALTGEGHEGQTYILTGKASISMADAASSLSNVLGTLAVLDLIPASASRVIGGKPPIASCSKAAFLLT